MRPILLTAYFLAATALPAAGATVCDPVTLRAEAPVRNAQFGCGVAIQGSTLAVSAHQDIAGTVTLFELGSPVPKATLVPPGGRPGDEFGRSLALDGDRLAVGAPLAGDGAGKVYVFNRQPSGAWVHSQTLVAGDAARADHFGFTLALQGNTLIAGSPNDDVAGSVSGSVYVFQLEGSAWTQKQKLTAGDAAAFDNFGLSLALSGDTVVVGAPFHDHGREDGRGAAYVFQRREGVWSQTVELRAGDGASGDQFGSSVALNGRWLAVGARGDDASQGQNAGSLYLYEAASWSQAAHFFGEAAGDLFGASASLSGDRLLVGSIFQGGHGAVYLFEWKQGPDGAFRWERGDTVDGHPAPGDAFGQSVSLDGNHLLVGSYLADVGALANAGSATTCEIGGNDDKVELRVEKTDHRTEVMRGETVIYKITVFNDGGAPAAAVQVTDTFSPKLADVSWCPPGRGQECANRIPGNLERTISLAPRSKVVFTATGIVRQTASGLLTNRACARLLPDGPTRCGRDEPDQIVIPPDEADLKLVKTAPGSASAGGRITYSLTVTNLGPDPATGVSLEDQPPAGLQAVASTGPGTCSVIGSGFSCRFADLAPGDSVTIHLEFEATESCIPNVINGAVVSADQDDIDPENNAVRVSTPLVRTADLKVEKTGPAFVEKDFPIPYVVKVTNLGPDRACGVLLRDPVPFGLSIPSPPPGCTVFEGREMLCPIDELGPGSRFEVSFEAPQTASCGSQIANTAMIVVPTGTTDPDEANSAAVAMTTVACCGLSITKTDGLTTAMPGQVLFHEITVTNTGNTLVDPARIDDLFPPELIPVKWCRDGDVIPCMPILSGDLHQEIALPPGASATYRSRGIVSPKFTGTLSNTATVAGPPGCGASATDETVIAATGVKAFCTSIDGVFTEGSMITKTLLLINYGPAAQADNPGDELTDILPGGLTLVSVVADSGTPSMLGNTASWNGAIPVGGMVMNTITAMINPATAGTTICNQATIAFDADGDGTNESVGLSDDPDEPGLADPCCFRVLFEFEVPALSPAGLAALALLLALAALARLRRRAP